MFLLNNINAHSKPTFQSIDYNGFYSQSLLFKVKTVKIPDILIYSFLISINRVKH